MSSENRPTRTWPELAIGLFEELTRRSAEITYEFDRMAVEVPTHAGSDAAGATWRIDGTLRVRTRDASSS